jgi:hypothetical protein
MNNTRKTTVQERQVMEYLNVLRNSGDTNMFGATPYITSKFGISSSEARAILALWMKNYNVDSEYETVKAE